LSGLAEFLPVSSHAHRAMLLQLLGYGGDDALLRLFAHIGALGGLFFAMRGHISQLRRQAALKRIPPRRRKRFPDPRYISELSLLKTAAIPLLLTLVFYFKTVEWAGKLQWVALFSLLNGLILLAPGFFATGNKDARSTSLLDRLLIGFSSIFSLLPGVSRVGVTHSAALLRGAAAEHACSWSLLLSLPALGCMILWDIYLAATSAHTISFLSILIGLLCCLFSFAGSCLAVTWMRSRMAKASAVSFGYYSLGAALFAFILYLI